MQNGQQHELEAPMQIVPAVIMGPQEPDESAQYHNPDGPARQNVLHIVNAEIEPGKGDPGNHDACADPGPGLADTQRQKAPGRERHLGMARGHAVGFAHCMVEAEGICWARVLPEVLQKCIDQCGNADQHGKPGEHRLAQHPVPERQKNDVKRGVSGPGEGLEHRRRHVAAQRQHPA
jgi:hypothetical protein